MIETLPGAATERVQFPVLDTLRAVGAIAVLTTHAAFWAGTYTEHGVWGTLLARLDVGVAIFFVLSGFLLALPFLGRAASGKRAPSTGRYLWKRFVRIAPVYVVTATLALLFIGANSELGSRDWLVTLTLGNTFVDHTLPDGLTQMWSLAVEVTFYLVLPLLMLVGVGRGRTLEPRRVITLLVILTAMSFWWHLSGAPRVSGVVSGSPSQWLPGYLSWFALGMFLALVHVLHQRGQSPRLTAPIVSLARLPGSCWAIAAGLLLVAATPLAGPSMLTAPTPAESLTKNMVYGIVGGLLVLTGIFPNANGAYRRALGHTWSRHLGFISYGIFCLHLPVLHLVMWLTGWHLFEGRFFAIWLFALVVSTAAAELVYRLVELPAMKLKNLGRPAPAQHKALANGTSITY